MNTTPNDTTLLAALKVLIDSCLEMGHESDALRSAITTYDAAHGCEPEDGPALAPLDALKALGDAMLSEVAS